MRNNDDNDNDAPDFDGNRCKLNPDKLRNALEAAVGETVKEAQVNFFKKFVSYKKVCFIQKNLYFFLLKIKLSLSLYLCARV